MWRLIVLAWLQFGICSTLQAEEIRVFFDGYRFMAPASPSVVLGGDDDFLLLKYGDLKGKNYLSIAKESIASEACTTTELLQALERGATDLASCEELLAAFLSLYKTHSRLSWLGANQQFLILDSGRSVSAFRALDAEHVLIIQSDFLSDTQWRYLLAETR